MKNVIIRFFLICSLVCTLASCSDNEDVDNTPREEMATQAERQEIKTIDVRGDYNITYDKNMGMWLFFETHDCMPPNVIDGYYIKFPEADYSCWRYQSVHMKGRGTLYKKWIYPDGRVVMFYLLELESIVKSLPPIED